MRRTSHVLTAYERVLVRSERNNGLTCSLLPCLCSCRSMRKNLGLLFSFDCFRAASLMILLCTINMKIDFLKASKCQRREHTVINGLSENAQLLFSSIFNETICDRVAPLQHFWRGNWLMCAATNAMEINVNDRMMLSDINRCFICVQTKWQQMSTVHRRPPPFKWTCYVLVTIKMITEIVIIKFICSADWNFCAPTLATTWSTALFCMRMPINSFGKVWQFSELYFFDCF